MPLMMTMMMTMFPPLTSLILTKKSQSQSGPHRPSQSLQ